MQFSIQCLTRWDLGFCLLHPIACWKLFSKENWKASSCPHTALCKVWIHKPCSLPHDNGVFLACLLSLFLQHLGHTIKHCYMDMYCPELLMCWMMVVPVCWTKHDVTRKYRGLVLISPFSVFFTREVGLCGKFLQEQEGKGREKQRM